MPHPDHDHAPNPAPQILIAPAAFKGTLSANDAARIIADTLREALPMARLEICPVADGGDDTLSVLLATGDGWQLRTAEVTGPVPEMTVTAQYLVHPQKKVALIEAAQAHGLKRLPSPQAMATTSYGVGELVTLAQQNPDINTVIVTLGGSASTDGGLGALQALGVRFLNAEGAPVSEPIRGETLAAVQALEWTPAAWPGRLLIATDVVNPLLGENGAANVFAAQKGATPEEIRLLEKELTRLADLITQATGLQLQDLPGVGAAGGLAYGLRHLPRSGIIPGSQWIAEALDLDAKIASSDLIVTGEGRLDATSFNGKATGHLLVQALLKPIVILCGTVEAGLQLPENVLILPLTGSDISPDLAKNDPQTALEKRIHEALPWIRNQLNQG